MVTPFETDRLLLREWAASDSERAFDLYSNWDVARWLGATPKAMETPDAAVATIERWSGLNLDEPIGGRWAVERKDDHRIAGTVLLVPLPDGAGEYEVGWHFHPDSWGQGFATESARWALERGWDGGLDEVYAVVRPDNAPSIAVCRRLGMTELGQSEKYYGAALELFGVNRSEWRA